MESKLYGVGGTSCYGAILGANPSTGARSPHLWNAVFRAFEVDAIFGAYDVVESELGDVVAQLKADPRFIGGAVGAPYKLAVVPFLDELEPECARIGAVNAIYRRMGRLVGANTDGQGAVMSLINFVKEPDWLRGKRVLIAGAGGAARGVAAYLVKSCGSRGRIRFLNRTVSKAQELAQSFKGYGCGLEVVVPRAVDAALAETDLLVNCTSVGCGDAAGTAGGRLLKLLSTPLAPLPESEEVPATVWWAAGVCGGNIAMSVERLARLPEHALVYDIVYQPPVTMLLKLADSLGLTTLNGEGMNLEQAVIACHNALAQSPWWKPEWSLHAIREVMAEVPLHANSGRSRQRSSRRSLLV